MKKIFDVISIILSVVVVVVFFTLEFLLGVERPVTKTMEVENLSVIMEEIDIERIFRDQNGKERPQGTRIYNYFNKIGLPRDDVDEVVKDKAFKKIIGTYLGTMFMNGITGTEVIYPSKTELVNFIHKHYSRFQKVTGFPKDYKQEEITRIVNENYGNVKYELDELAKDIKWDKIGNIDLIKKIMSTKTVFIIGGLVLCTVLLIFLRHSLYAWLKWVSIPTILNGIFTLTGGIVGKSIVKLFADFTNYDFILNPIVDDILKNMKLFGIIELALGAISLITYIVISKATKKPKIKHEEVKEEREEKEK